MYQYRFTGRCVPAYYTLVLRISGAHGITAGASGAVALPPTTGVAGSDPASSCARCAAVARCVIKADRTTACVCPSDQIGDGMTCTANGACQLLGCSIDAQCLDRNGKKVCECKPG